jgi:hypothetical protein
MEKGHTHMSNRKLILLVALVLAIPFVAPGDAQAAHDKLTTYYTGSCPTGLTYNGFEFRECDSSYSYDGTLDGTWKCDDRYDCAAGVFTYFWYEKCNGQWSFRYAVADVNQWPDETDCHCT